LEEVIDHSDDHFLSQFLTEGNGRDSDHANRLKRTFFVEMFLFCGCGDDEDEDEDEDEEDEFLFQFGHREGETRRRRGREKTNSAGVKKFLNLNDVSGSGVGARLEGEEGVLFDLTLFVHRLDDLKSDVDGRLLA